MFGFHLDIQPGKYKIVNVQNGNINIEEARTDSDSFPVVAFPIPGNVCEFHTSPTSSIPELLQWLVESVKEGLHEKCTIHYENGFPANLVHKGLDFLAHVGEVHVQKEARPDEWCLHKHHKDIPNIYLYVFISWQTLSSTFFTRIYFDKHAILHGKSHWQLKSPEPGTKVCSVPAAGNVASFCFKVEVNGDSEHEINRLLKTVLEERTEISFEEAKRLMEHHPYCFWEFIPSPL